MELCAITSLSWYSPLSLFIVSVTTTSLLYCCAKKKATPKKAAGKTIKKSKSSPAKKVNLIKYFYFLNLIKEASRCCFCLQKNKHPQQSGHANRKEDKSEP
jgi:hypothetical protein